MITLDQADRALMRLTVAILLTQSPDVRDRKDGSLKIAALINSTRDRIEALRPYRTECSLHRLDGGVLMLRLALMDTPLLPEFTQLPTLQAIGLVVQSSLGIQQWSLIGCDGKGLSVQHYNDQWIMEAVA